MGDIMKKNKTIIIILTALIVVIIVAILLVVLITGNKKENTIDYVYIENTSGKIDIQSGYIFKDYQMFRDYFDSDNLKESDFKSNNYVVVELLYDPCSEHDIKLVNYNLKGNNLDVYFTYKSVCGGCAPEYGYYLLPVDKDLENINVDIDSKATNNANCPDDVAYKPIIYLYPEEEMNVSVKLLNSNYLTTTYPKYVDSWEVNAKPNGDLIDLKTGRYLYGLYWEGNNHKASVMNDGFIVRGEESLTFLEEKLAILGLTEREADEFIIYWLPKLEVNKYNYIRFETMEEIDEYMPLSISPKPDTVIRVLMSYKPLDEEIKVSPQVLNEVVREGFTVVEWGGTKIK